MRNKEDVIKAAKSAIEDYGNSSISLEVRFKTIYLMYDDGRDRFMIQSFSKEDGKFDIYDEEEIALLAEDFNIKHNLNYL